MEKDDEEIISPAQEQSLLQTVPGIHKFISRKLGSHYRDSVEDLKQRIILKLWRWKQSHKVSHLSDEDWQKMARVVARNEVTDFFREKYTRDVQFSHLDENSEERVLSIRSTANLEGNSRTEICSLLALVWKAAQKLTLRQKYVYFLQYSDFIVEFIACGCCSIKELADYFEITEPKLSKIFDALPLTDESLRNILEERLGEKVMPKQIWEARSKAKAKLAANLKEFIFNERLPVRKRH